MFPFSAMAPDLWHRGVLLAILYDPRALDINDGDGDKTQPPACYWVLAADSSPLTWTCGTPFQPQASTCAPGEGGILPCGSGGFPASYDPWCPLQSGVGEAVVLLCAPVHGAQILRSYYRVQGMWWRCFWVPAGLGLRLLCGYGCCRAGPYAQVWLLLAGRILRGLGQRMLWTAVGPSSFSTIAGKQNCPHGTRARPSPPNPQKSPCAPADPSLERKSPLYPAPALPPVTFPCHPGSSLTFGHHSDFKSVSQP